MEVFKDDYELVAQRTTMYGIFQITYDKATRNYLYLHRKRGVVLGREYAGVEQANAIEGFDKYIEERSITL